MNGSSEDSVFGRLSYVHSMRARRAVYLGPRAAMAEKEEVDKLRPQIQAIFEKFKQQARIIKAVEEVSIRAETVELASV